MAALHAHAHRYCLTDAAGTRNSTRVRPDTNAALITELAALLDVGQLQALIGDAVVQRLRAGARGDGGRVEPLAALLAHDDLRLFCGMLLGAVQRRAVPAQRPAEHPAAAPC